MILIIIILNIYPSNKHCTFGNSRGNYGCTLILSKYILLGTMKGLRFYLVSELTSQCAVVSQMLEEDTKFSGQRQGRGFLTQGIGGTMRFLFAWFPSFQKFYWSTVEQPRKVYKPSGFMLQLRDPELIKNQLIKDLLPNPPPLCPTGRYTLFR